MGAGSEQVTASDIDKRERLEHSRSLCSAGATPDDRLTEALELVESAANADGGWPLENTHPGAVHFDLEDGDGEPSRWNALRALRVREWAGSAQPTSARR